MKTKQKGLYIALEASLAGAVAMAVAAYAVRGQSDLKVEERTFGKNSAFIMDY